MKRLGRLALLYTLLLACTAILLCAAAEAIYTCGDYRYKLLDNGTAEITGYTGKTNKLSIPGKLNGYPVTSIGDRAFFECKSLTSVTIPDGVTSIGDEAFSWCTSLWSITIPDSVTSIGDYAFYKCKLESVTIPDSVTSIGDEAFSYCNYLTSITIPDSVTHIGKAPFQECQRLKSIIVWYDHPSLVTIDGVLFDKLEMKLIWYPYAFRESSYVIPTGVKSIGEYAFGRCPFLESITIPDSVTHIGANPFRECYGLTHIKLSPDHPVLATIDGVLFDKTEKKLICYPHAITQSSYVIPTGIKSIGDYAFYCCASLTSVTIPDGVTSIGDHAFDHCSSLTSITIPDSVTHIGVLPFAYCAKLTRIVVSPDHPVLATIDGVLFDKTEKKLLRYPQAFTQTSYVIPTGVTSIEDIAFYNCTSLTSITIPDSVTSIGDYAFRSCTSLTSITIPDSVTSIGDYAFCFCTSLTSITIPDSVTSIGDNAFEGCSDRLMFTVPRNSWAEMWCRENGLNYAYPDALDWLNS